MNCSVRAHSPTRRRCMRGNTAQRLTASDSCGVGWGGLFGVFFVCCSVVVVVFPCCCLHFLPVLLVILLPRFGSRDDDGATDGADPVLLLALRRRDHREHLSRRGERRNQRAATRTAIHMSKEREGRGMRIHIAHHTTDALCALPVAAAERTISEL